MYEIPLFEPVRDFVLLGQIMSLQAKLNALGHKTINPFYL